MRLMPSFVMGYNGMAQFVNADRRLREVHSNIRCGGVRSMSAFYVENLA